MQDSFDGSQGFAIGGGIKDATSVVANDLLSLAALTLRQAPPISVDDPVVPDACHRRCSPAPSHCSLHSSVTVARRTLTLRCDREPAGVQCADDVLSLETLDWSSLVAGSRVAAGLDAFDSEKVRSDVPSSRIPAYLAP
jgi:hypothetical protein